MTHTHTHTHTLPFYCGLQTTPPPPLDWLMSDAAAHAAGAGGIPTASQYTGKALHQFTELNGVFIVEQARHCPQKHHLSSHTTEPSSKRGVSRVGVMCMPRRG